MVSKHLLVLITVLFLTPRGAFAAQAVSSAASDDTLKSRVEASIGSQPALKHQDIDVDVDKGVVTLSGTVQSAARKERAEHAAHVRGVTRVVNNLTVDPHGGKNIVEKSGGAAKTAASKTGEAAKTAGEKTKDGVSATGEVINDAWINTKVHANMMNEPLLHRSDINVDVHDHVVTLKGTVETAAGKARAEQIAKSTEGVRGVVNDLAIGPKR